MRDNKPAPAVVAIRPSPIASHFDSSDFDIDVCGRPLAKRFALRWAILTATLITFGLLLVHPFKDTAVTRWDVNIVQTLANHRTSGLTNLSLFWTRLADAPQIAIVGVLGALLLLVSHRKRAAVVLLAAMVIELVTFLAVSYSVHRPRPDVVHLSSLPSTGSFPSGHVAATVVLYGTFTMLLSMTRCPRALVIVSGIWVVAAALFVGWSRIYRGMHHPIDVLCGAAMGAGLLFAIFTALSFAAVKTLGNNQ